MTLIVLGEAEEEFAQSVAYYECKETGLGTRCRNEVAEGIQRILRHPSFRGSGQRGVGDSISAFFLITSLTSFAVKRFGSWQSLTGIGGQNFGSTDSEPPGRAEEARATRPLVCVRSRPECVCASEVI
jgi:hypothetical protein